jgi:hypothetical protein
MNDPELKSHWQDEHGLVVVMAVVDGWIMARRLGCVPFTEPLKSWHRRFKPAALPARPRKRT